jgi:hypothetical protein
MLYLDSYVKQTAVRYFLILSSTLLSPDLSAQTGPNSPSTVTNNAVIGANVWGNPAQVVNSDNQYADVNTKGVTQYLSGTGFGFAIPATEQIDGIQLELEKSTTSYTSVAVLNDWATGMTRTITAGVARCMVVSIVLENGLGPRDVTALTYGGQALTQITEDYVGASNGFMGKIEYWRLMETGIAAAANTSFVITFDGTSLLENWEALSSAVYQHVDQTVPVANSQNFTSNNANNPITMSPGFTVDLGNMAISTVFCGNNRTPAATAGQSNNFSINSGFTEVIDTYSAGTAAPGSGGCFQIAHKSIVTAGTEAPTYTFAGTPNRQVAICLQLQKIREADHSVRLLKGGVITGNDYAQTTAAWGASDTYVVYGGPADLWGSTWTYNDVNATNFGAVVSASVQNGTARIDHIRITVYTSAILPVELLDFSCQNNGGQNILSWHTASELNSSHFELERATDNLQFEMIGTVPAQGNSRNKKSYSLIDDKPFDGINYYRLKQMDLDRHFEYSQIIFQNNKNESEQPFFVFPNPSDSEVQISRPADKLELYNSGLKLVRTFFPSELSFSLSGLADGTYYLTYFEKGVRKAKVIQKQSR